ncbi:outer membrane protein assembly factor BamB family protein [Hufsiella ginkgonis]|uniref:PQQ-binding-like beta-propeller repeat protein n=1 Tax=Hufsiella ginkgonis TaxID=2695274 RepID=A0A7K1Y222_9SPHI|nr:PQQ-binding-like beta-propeller repeat protein [Hufsiella ginkgonis]MXV17069.1 PQQ-binding-like beta-propeller repeat protein [Hufsiella ginkgonis]
MKQTSALLTILFAVLFLSWNLAPGDSPASGADWREYLGGADRNHYSTLTQINQSNVSQLEIAWEYHTGIPGAIQCNPVIVDGVLYGMNASAQPFALNAATGEEIWKRKTEAVSDLNTSRGLTYWEEGGNKRIIFTNGEWLYAANAATGELIANFGNGGRVSLKTGLGSHIGDKWVVSNAPGTLFGDLVIMPLRVSDGDNAAIGHIQAFNVRTGELAWVFHTIPLPGEYGANTWPKNVHNKGEIGGVNNWAGMAIDRERGIVYVPTGSAANDFYGVNRRGSNLFANCLLALDARTGKRIWHFQFVHHDLLDRDCPAAPNLVTLTRNGQKIDAVAQVTKQGLVFVFDRVTGAPLFPIRERPVPASDIPGEHAWPTQPFPLKPAPFVRQSFRERDISPLAPDRAELLARLRKSRSEGPYTPLSKRGSVIFPGLDGGAEWGGAAADPQGVLYVNSNEMPWLISLKPTPANDELAGMTEGGRLYTTNCVTCHGAERKGNPGSGFPSLVNVADTRSRAEVMRLITAGKGMMPAFTKFKTKEKDAIVAFLFSDEKREAPAVARPATVSPRQSPLQISGYSKFLSKDGYPAISPPWGTLNAIDLNTGEYRWKIPYGEYPGLLAKGIPQTGAENYGGPIVTASGLLLIAGTKDGKFRAYDKATGKLIWEVKLPFACFATPSTYMANGKQYVVLACGGSKLGAPRGDSFVAYALR